MEKSTETTVLRTRNGVVTINADDMDMFFNSKGVCISRYAKLSAKRNESGDIVKYIVKDNFNTLGVLNPKALDFEVTDYKDLDVPFETEES